MTLLLAPTFPTKKQSHALLAGERFYMISDSIKATLRHESISVTRLSRLFARRKKFINRVLAFEFHNDVEMRLAA